MTAVLVPCRGCNSSVRVDSRQISVRVCKDDHALNHYDFPCPGCGVQQSNPASDHIIATLVGVDCLVTYWSKLEPHPAPALTWDDLLEFHQNIDRELASLLRGAA